MSPSLVYIVLGTLLIAAGGLLATYGWDIRSSKDTRDALQLAATDQATERRQAMLRMLAAEFVFNSSLLQHRKFTEPDDEQLKNVVSYPRLQSGALTSAIASGLFASTEDKQLLTLVFEMQASAIEFNNRLLATENYVLRSSAEATLRTRKLLRDGKMLKGMRARLQKFGKALLANGIDPNEKFFDMGSFDDEQDVRAPSAGEQENAGKQ